MRIVVALLLSGALMAVPAAAPAQVPETAVELKDEPPTWFTPALQERIDGSGTQGIAMTELMASPSYCPGVQPQAGVSAGTCMFWPSSCSANFVFYSGRGTFPPVSEGTHHFIGTAGHCVDFVGQPVYMQVESPGIGPAIARVGTVAAFVANGLGDDFASIRIASGFAVNPAFPMGGPRGINTGCWGRAVKYWGHGYQGATAQGKPLAGFAGHWYDDAYGFSGVSARGDSGAGVVLNTNEAAGNLTHLVANRRFPSSDVVGTRMTKILRFLGPDFKLVNEDRTLVRETTTIVPCTGALMSAS